MSNCPQHPRRTAVALAAALAIAALLGVPLAGSAVAADLAVVATSKPIHSLVAAVMGSTGSPKLLVDGNASPHTYAMKPSDAKAVHQSKVLFRVSEGLEPFTGKLVKSLPRSVIVVSLQDAPGITLLDRRKGGAFETHAHATSKKGHAHDDHDDEHDAQAGTDPHVWLDPANARAMVDHIAATLATANPADAAAYKANADTVKSGIAALADELTRDLAPLAGRPFVMFHDSMQYFERRFGLASAGTITVSPEVQPSAKRLNAIRAKIGQLAAVCVFAEPQFKSKLVETVVEGTSAKTGTLDPEGGLLTAGPGLYPALMRALARNLASCLAGAS
ncbi:MAG: zinc ABC transporter substrate-binding protein [Hyphomicrobium sp.]